MWHKTLKQNKKCPPLLPLIPPLQSHLGLQIRQFYGLELLSTTSNLLHCRFTTALLQMATVRNCLFLWAEQYGLHKTYMNFIFGIGKKHRFKIFLGLIKKKIAVPYLHVTANCLCRQSHIRVTYKISGTKHVIQPDFSAQKNGGGTPSQTDCTLPATLVGTH